ncbi:MAG: CaiB/BaiF CoA transferase family protein [Gammaproteobacteria bacterium]
MGPLAGMKIIEFEAIGPAPFVAMTFADMGATVLRLVRRQSVELSIARGTRFEATQRGRYPIRLDLKDPTALDVVRALIDRADGLIEGFRPGVMERLGLGPAPCLERNPKLVYGRISGWGQAGPLAHGAAHDINYIAVTGVLNAIGRTGQLPANPLALVGDFGGGAMFLSQGMLAAMLHAVRGGPGQVVDVSIAEGAASLATYYYGAWASGTLSPGRGSNATDGGSHFYNTYECADGRLVSVGAIESRFYAELLARLEIAPESLGDQKDPANWPRATRILAEKFKTRTRDEWCRLLEGSDACFAPVLDWDEAPEHPQFIARGTFVDVDGVRQPRHAPRFSATPCADPTPPRDPSAEDTHAALAPWLPAAEVDRLRNAGVLD